MSESSYPFLQIVTSNNCKMLIWNAKSLFSYLRDRNPRPVFFLTEVVLGLGIFVMGIPFFPDWNRATAQNNVLVEDSED